MIDAPALTVRTRMVMGLPFSLHLRGAVSRDAADTAAAGVWQQLRQADTIFSTYRPDSDISRLANGEATVDQLDPMVRWVLGSAERARRVTGGLFDINGGGRLDPSGLVKGWAAQLAIRRVRLPGVDRYLNAGGDIAMRAFGPAHPWRIGIEHPDDPAGLLTVLCRTGGAVATSGTAHRGQHLWDPRTGRPAVDVWQATVVGRSLMWADILATAAAVAGPADLDRRHWPPGYQVLLAGPGGEVVASQGFGRLLAPDVPALRISRWL
ncbi:MAG: FAD:protein FMN transferase [Actinomycetota bacterium]|nr:FAD:protein FMN transferase [Actinomycetota bacterium]